jgi:hypothetical protein
MAVDCKATKKLKLCAYGIPGQGFYSMEIPEAKIKVSQATCFITALEGEATEDKISKELKNLVRNDWDFRVKQSHHQEYMVIFPDRATMGIFSKLSEFAMPLYGLKGKLIVANVDPEATSVLHTVWIKLSNIPGTAKDVESIKEIVNLVAEPIAVDEVSLIKPGPVRVQGRCRNPTLIKGSIEVFFNGAGIPIGFEVEDDKGSSKGGKGGPPGQGSGKPGGSSDKDFDKHHQDGRKRGNDKFKRYGDIDRDREANPDDSMEDSLEKEVLEESNDVSNGFVIPLAAFHPEIGHILLNSSATSLTQQDKSDPVQFLLRSPGRNLWIR